MTEGEQGHGHGHGQQSLLLRALPTSLPKVQVWKLPALDPRSVQDSGHYERFGYNGEAEEATWKQEMHYTRWVPPLEQELASQVEYDMDESDREWLDALNAERAAEGIPEPLSYEFFEIIVDKLEKLWFSLQKHTPRPANNLPAEDSLCAVCDDGECEASNAIVFCDGCNLAVHQGGSTPVYLPGWFMLKHIYYTRRSDCYGVPYIPEGQWLCRKCTVSPDRPVVRALCSKHIAAY